MRLIFPPVDLARFAPAPPPPGPFTVLFASSPDKEGWLGHKSLQGGYAYWAAEAEAAGVWLLEASGHAMVYVNGEPRAGDIYQTGYVRLPVQLKKGTNHLLFHAVRGRVRAKLVPVKSEAMFNPPILPVSLAPAFGATICRV